MKHIFFLSFVFSSVFLFSACEKNKRQKSKRGERAEKESETSNESVSAKPNGVDDVESDFLTKAKVVRAKMVCANLERAVELFENEYQFLPFAASEKVPEKDQTVRSDDGLISVLAGKEDKKNYKMVQFIQVQDAKGSDASTYRDGMHVDGDKAVLYDPWGHLYYIAIDYDYSGEIQHPFEKGEVLRGKKVFVYSAGPDGEVGTKEKDRDNVDSR